MLACRTIMEQGIQVIGLKFITPFFDDHLREQEEQYRAEVYEKYGIDVRLVDLSEGYLELLRNPAHGFGKNFNPCIDCKILMISTAKKLMAEYGASFMITGEVLGQRPMSQRRDALRVIERDSETDDILLRPLCAKLMKETKAEREGLVDREKLHSLSGRSRKGQKELAASLGITDYPNAAGGCLLTDVNLGARIARFYAGEFTMGKDDFEASDIRLLLAGRQFRLPDGSWLVLGRIEQENDNITKLCRPGDWLLKMPERPGPTAIICHADDLLSDSSTREETLRQAAGLVVYYGRKKNGVAEPSDVRLTTSGGVDYLHATPVTEEDVVEWRM